MAEYLSPGVYVEEFESGPRPMEGVSTSTAGFVGVAQRGPLTGQPVLITNFSDFYRKFGGYLSEIEWGEYRYLAYSVEQFFVNGGSRCYVMRVAPSDAKMASNSKFDSSSALLISAKEVGAWGNSISITCEVSSKAKTQVLEKVESEAGIKYKFKSVVGFGANDVVEFFDGKQSIYNRITKINDNFVEFENEFEVDVVDVNLLAKKVIKRCDFNLEVKYGDATEKYEFLSFNPMSEDFVEKKLEKSELIEIQVKAGNDIKLPMQIISSQDEAPEVLNIELAGGKDGTASKLSASDFIGNDKGPSNRTGLQAFLENNNVSIMAIPGIVDLNVQLALVAHCENMANRFAILDIPKESKNVADIQKHRDVFDTQYAAMYHPWINAFDHLDKKNISLPPSGAIAGVYARVDQQRGVFKAPANENLRNVVKLDCNYNEGEQDILNPIGVNLIRSFQGQGIKVWGARTLSSNSLWKYVNVRRLFIFLEESIKNNTGWVVFEPNDEMLWVRVRRTIEVFLDNVWRSGALAGNTASEAFYVNIGRTTMSEDDIQNGRLICEIGVAPVKPAEFVIFRITQKTSQSAE